MLTFDDAVTAANYKYIQETIVGRTNPDGCAAAATFFVSHEYTDYSKVHALWTEGHEIALHSIRYVPGQSHILLLSGLCLKWITIDFAGECNPVFVLWHLSLIAFCFLLHSHNPTVNYWKTASVDLLMQEFNDERDLISHFAQIDREDIKGVRMPLFQLSGNNSFEMIKRAGLYYDCSMPTQHFTNPGMWPYSLEYASIQDCPLDNCPVASIPDVWVAPILSWTDLEGYQCAMVDACQYL